MYYTDKFTRCQIHRMIMEWLNRLKETRTDTSNSKNRFSRIARKKKKSSYHWEGKSCSSGCTYVHDRPYFSFSELLTGKLLWTWGITVCRQIYVLANPLKMLTGVGDATDIEGTLYKVSRLVLSADGQLNSVEPWRQRSLQVLKRNLS